MGNSTAQPREIGLYNLNMAARGGGEKLTLVLASHLSNTQNVRLFHDTELNTESLQETFAVDLSRVRFTKLGPLRFQFRVLAKTRGARLSPFSLHHSQQLKRLNLDLFINVSHGSVLPCPAANGIFVCMFPHRFGEQAEGGRLQSRIRRRLVNVMESSLSGASEQNWLDSYERVVAISEFSSEWIERLWRRPSEVVYPPVEDMGPPASKARMILHVGRFTPPVRNRHHKAQDVLLETFKGMTEHQRNGWELHFAGNVRADAETNAFTNELLQRAEGLPVKFHFNAKFDELRELYRRAAIYWHATGVGSNGHHQPEMHEHFGITTVEAMTAGAVPVVISLGGQPEIVTDGVNGMCWKNIGELVERTELLINDSDLRQRLTAAAIDSSKKFSRAKFIANMDRLIANCLEASRPAPITS